MTMTQAEWDSLEVGDVVRLVSRDLNNDYTRDRLYACRYVTIAYVPHTRATVDANVRIECIVERAL